MHRSLDILRNEKGTTALEYGLLATLIAAVIVVTVTNLGLVVSQTFNFITGTMGTALS